MSTELSVFIRECSVIFSSHWCFTDLINYMKHTKYWVIYWEYCPSSQIQHQMNAISVCMTEEEVCSRLQATGLQNRNELTEFVFNMEHSTTEADRIMYRRWRHTFADQPDPRTYCVNLYLDSKHPGAVAIAPVDHTNNLRDVLATAAAIYRHLPLFGDARAAHIAELRRSLRAALDAVPAVARYGDSDLNMIWLTVNDAVAEQDNQRFDALLNGPSFGGATAAVVAADDHRAADWLTAQPDAAAWGDFASMRATLWGRAVGGASLPAWLPAAMLLQALGSDQHAEGLTNGVRTLLTAWMLRNALLATSGDTVGAADCAAFLARIAADGRCTPALLRELLRLEPAAATHAAPAIADRPAVARIRDRDDASAVDADVDDAPPRQRARISAGPVGDDLGRVVRLNAQYRGKQLLLACAVERLLLGREPTLAELDVIYDAINKWILGLVQTHTSNTYGLPVGLLHVVVYSYSRCCCIFSDNSPCPSPIRAPRAAAHLLVRPDRQHARSSSDARAARGQVQRVCQHHPRPAVPAGGSGRRWWRRLGRWVRQRAEWGW